MKDLPKTTEQVGRPGLLGPNSLLLHTLSPPIHKLICPQGVSKKMGENLEGLQEPQLGLKVKFPAGSTFLRGLRNRAVLTACK